LITKAPFKPVFHFGVKISQLGFESVKNFRQDLGYFMTFPIYGVGTKCNNQIVDRRVGNC